MTLRIMGIYDQTGFSYERTGQVISQNQVWLVQLNGLASRAQATNLFESDSRLPVSFDQNAQYAGVYCTKVGYSQIQDTPDIWKVTALWESKKNLTDTIKDPTLRPALIATGTYKQQKSPVSDFDGVPVATTAGEPIDFTYQKSFPTFTLQKKLAQYPVILGKNRDFVNKDSVTFLGITYKPYELFCSEINIGFLQWEGSYPYYDFQAVFYADTDEFGWRTRLRNQGYHERKFLGYELLDTGGEDHDKPKYAFEAIRMGTPGKYAYPSSPVLINPEGQAFRQKLPGDPDDGSKNTGPVIGLHVAGEPVTTSGITKKQWDAAVVEVRFYNLISFNQYFPLK